MNLRNSPIFTTIVNECAGANVKVIPVFHVESKDLDRTYRLSIAHHFLRQSLIAVVVGATKIATATSVADAMKVCSQFDLPLSLAALIEQANKMDGWSVATAEDDDFQTVFLSYIAFTLESAKSTLPLEFGTVFDPGARMITASTALFLKNRFEQVLFAAKRIFDQEDVDASMRAAEELGLRCSIDDVVFYTTRYAAGSSVS